MKKYIFEEYRDKAGSGSEHLFDTKNEAVDFAQIKWEKLTSGDKKSYLTDSFAIFRVYEVDANLEQIKDFADPDGILRPSEFESTEVWNALEEA